MQQPRSTRLGPLDILVAALVNLFWGLNIIAVKISVGAIAPIAAGGLRQAIVLAICLPFLRLVPGRMALLFGLALLNGAGFILLANLALKISDNVSALAIAGQLSVPFSLLLGVLVLKEQIAGPRMIGIALAFGGVALLSFDPGIEGEVPGLVLTAASAFAWALGALIQRKLAGVSVLTLYAWIGVGGVAILLPASAVMEPGALTRLPDLPLRGFGAILFSALGSTIIGHGGVAWLLQRHPISTVLPLTLAAPVIAVATSSLLFGTRLTPLVIAGGVLTMAGVAIITLRTARAEREHGE